MQDTKQEQGATKQSLTTIETRVHRAIIDHKAIGTREITVKVISDTTGLPWRDVDDALVALSSKDIVGMNECEVCQCEDLGYIFGDTQPVDDFPNVFTSGERSIIHTVITDPLVAEYVRRLEHAVNAGQDSWSHPDSHSLAGYAASKRFRLSLLDIGCLGEDL